MRSALLRACHSPGRRAAVSMSTRPPVTLVFDLDGTLCETAPDLHAAVNDMLCDAGRSPITLAQCKNFIGDGMLKLAERAFEATGVLPPTDEFIQRHAAFVAAYNDACCVDTHTYSGVHETLQALRDKGYLCCVATNKPQAPADTIIDGLGLRTFFGDGAVVGGDALAVKKPDPEHLAAAVRRVGGDATRAIMVGDGHNDVLVGKAANVPVVALSYGYTRVPLVELGPDVIVDEFSDVLREVEKLAPV